MINKPGTLLIVRKKSRNRLFVKDGIFGVFWEKTKYAEEHPNFRVYKELPYGACVILLSLEKNEYYYNEYYTGGVRFRDEYYTGGVRFRMEVLYGDKILVGTVTNNQCNKWFTYPKTWERHYAQKQETKENTNSKLKIE